MPKNFIVTNFAYGTGPYLRTTELALAFNDELEYRGKERLGIIVPLVYGEKQKKIMLEEFNYLDTVRLSEEIWLDEKLGTFLESVFYRNGFYENALAGWIKDAKRISQEAHKYLSGKINVVNLFGKFAEIDGKNIILELNRSPRVRYDIAPIYSTTFGYVAEILENAAKVPHEKIRTNKDLLKCGVEIADWIESQAKLHTVAYPATFSWQKHYKPRYATEILTPPITRSYPANVENINPGIFVTITGIPGLEHLYSEARVLGLNLYSNNTKAVADSTWALPHIITNQNIVFQFARSGWSSVWFSMMSGTPLVVPNFDQNDDPEIYFNNLAIEKLGIGIVYRGQPLEEIFAKVPEVKANSKKLCDEIRSRWSGAPDPLDGNRFCAKLFAEDFLKRI